MMEADEYYYSCTTHQKQMLVKYLSEDNLIDEKTSKYSLKDNVNDLIYKDNLKILFNKRHLLSAEEESYINDLANRLKYF